MSARPYRLSEEDNLRLFHIQQSLRFVRYLAEAPQQSEIETDLLASYLWLIEAQIGQVMDSAEQSTASRPRRSETK